MRSVSCMQELGDAGLFLHAHQSSCQGKPSAVTESSEGRTYLR